MFSNYSRNLLKPVQENPGENEIKTHRGREVEVTRKCQQKYKLNFVELNYVNIHKALLGRYLRLVPLK